ncbi:MAG TPA: ChbG/HpnK family deacetylase [Terriglobia bacterium]|nr:ChbG/HpnK family deacetylase [Terriglobia bacterium]
MSSISEGSSKVWESRSTGGIGAGFLIVNADDWGCDHLSTDRTLECVLRGAVSSVSAMVFMQDSERAAGIARVRGIDAGLHLNLTTPFSSPRCPDGLAEHQRKLAAYLRRSRFAQVLFNPALAGSFDYVVKAQVEEYCRLYGTEPERIDGHHHMHLCSNVLWGRLLPAGTIVRRNFSFQAGEKSLWNRLYRKIVDRRLERRHRVTDYFFSLVPLEPVSRLQQVFSMSSQSVVEVETHPANEGEFRFLAGGEIFRHIGEQRIASCYLARNGCAKH